MALQATRDNEQVIERIAALDIGKEEVVCCVRVPDPGSSGKRLQEVTTHRTMTRSLLVMCDRLRDLGVTRVIMEATSDYWKSPFYLLEAAGFETWLVNAKDVRHLPGRPKTDLLTELRGRVSCFGGRLWSWVITVPDHDRGWGCSEGSVTAGGAAVRRA